MNERNRGLTVGTRTTLHQTTFAICALLGAVGVTGLIATLPWYHTMTLVAAVGGPAFVLSEAYRMPGLPAGYIFTWIVGILFGGMGITSLALLT